MVDYDYVKWCETAMGTASQLSDHKDANYKPEEIKG